MSLTRKEVFAGYNLIGSCIVDHDYFCLVLEEDQIDDEYSTDEGVRVRFTIYNMAREPSKRWGL